MVINPGLHVFDGDMALKFVRSRHYSSDFDRSNRQQILASAIKEKLISEGYLLSPRKVEDLFTTLSSHLLTDMPMSQIIHAAALLHDFDSDHMYNYNINDSCFSPYVVCQAGGLLYTPDRAQT